MTDTAHLIWTQPEWIAGAQAWIEEALHAAGMRLTGPIEQPHVRPWATVMRAPTDSGLFYFKASIPPLAFEPALVLALAQTSPACPEVLAADTAKGWMLTRDAGTPLREVLKLPEDLGQLDGVLAMLAELQMQWAGRGDELVAMGVPDARLRLLPGRFERLAAQREQLMAGEYGLDEAQYARLAAMLPVFAEMCARLAASGIAESIHFDDMHGGNVFLRQQEGVPVKVTFQDWGDSSVGHPFCSLLIFIRAMADQMNLPEASTQTPEGLPPMLARLRDSYLKPWRRMYPQADLVETFNLAWRVGMVARALSWDASNRALDERDRPALAYTVPAWLGEFLLAMPA